MATITKINVLIQTGNRNNAGTDGHVFIAIGGREFHLNSATDDFEQGKAFTYTLGTGSTVTDSTNNDPTKPFSLNTADLDKFPAWIRFEPAGSNPGWNLEFASATVNPGPNEVKYQALAGDGNLWLGQNSGKYCFLKRV